MHNGEPGARDEPHWMTQRPWAVEGHVLYALPDRGRLIIGMMKNAAVAAHIADVHNAALAAAAHPPVPPAEPAPAVPPPAVDGHRPATSAEIRAWAKTRGYQLSERGRIPAHIRQHYDEVHGTGK